VSEPNPKAGEIVSKAKAWRAEMERLRAIALDCPLTEEVKWGWPCYALDGQNVVLIHAFKEYCALLFLKGALMPDPQSILIQQTANVQAARQMRFTSLDEIARLETVVKSYIHDAIEIEKSGAKVAFKQPAEFAIPAEFQAKLDAMPALKAAFTALTPGRQRGYLLHFSGAKQAKTKEARIEKCLGQILAGKGLDD
jgi:uncharacterized protein YdeI (YjbR/CyaY-like superfamily)